ncbi:Imm52 family immunity protein [Flavobacterium hauense]
MSKKTFIGGYWKQRPEDINIATNKIEQFLLKLADIDDIFSDLKLPAYSKKKAMESHFMINPSSISEELIKSRKKNEVDERGFCEIGFSFSLFNETDKNSVVISFNIGASSKYISNVCYVDMKGELPGEKEKQFMLKLIQEIFKPETIKFE